MGLEARPRCCCAPNEAAACTLCPALPQDRHRLARTLLAPSARAGAPCRLARYATGLRRCNGLVMQACDGWEALPRRSALWALATLLSRRFYARLPHHVQELECAVAPAPINRHKSDESLRAPH